MILTELVILGTIQVHSNNSNILLSLTLKSQEDSLLRILFALSNSVPKIGYVQGMNTMTAVFLATRLKESEIYWLIRYIFYKKKFDEVLHDGFPQVQVLNYQLEIYAKNYIPELVEHLVRDLHQTRL